jgi:hypothetical protein
MKYLRSILSGPISALSIVILSTPFWWLRFEDVSLLVAIGWTIGWAIFEIVWVIRKQSSTPRLLTHLRWGPVAVLLIFIGVVVSYDNIRIYQSKQAIKNYIYYGSDSDSEFDDLRLHTEYRGWCGNGTVEAYYETYIDTALEGFESESPAVRLRALRFAHSLSFGSFDDRYRRLIDRAFFDSDLTVARLAHGYRAQYYGIRLNID